MNSSLGKRDREVAAHQREEAIAEMAVAIFVRMKPGQGFVGKKETYEKDNRAVERAFERAEAFYAYLDHRRKDPSHG